MQRPFFRWIWPAPGIWARGRVLVFVTLGYALILAASERWFRLPQFHGSGLRQTVVAPPGERAEPIRFQRITPALDFSFLDENPDLARRPFSVQWEGYWYVPETEGVELYAAADGRVLISIEGEPVLKRGADAGPDETSCRLQLPAGFHALAVESEHDGGEPRLSVRWATAGRLPEPLAPTSLFPVRPPSKVRAAVARAHRWRAVRPFLWLGPPIVLAFLLWRATIARGLRRLLRVGSALILAVRVRGTRTVQALWAALERRAAVAASDADAWRTPGLEWVNQHPVRCLLGVVALAFALRVLLAAGSPVPYGYVYDPYHDPVERLYLSGRLPESPECWQCYHPPLFTLLALPFYAAGMWISGGERDVAFAALATLATVCGVVVAYYGYRLLTLFRFRGLGLVIGAALLLITPVIVLSSYGSEADVVLAAVMVAFLYHLTRYHLDAGAARVRLVVALGVLAGLAMATKYSGLIALVVAGQVTALRLVLGPRRLRAARDGIVILATCLAVGSWKYVDNFEKYGDPLFANGPAQDGFRLGSHERNVGRYDFTSFKMVDLLALTRADAPDGGLTFLPVYRSVWTTLYGQTWSDMGFFSNPTRGGMGLPYVWRGVPPWLAGSVLVLGLVPTMLAAIGMVSTARRPATLPIALLGVTAVTAYVYWFTAQEYWALKTKYLLFLIPAYILYALFGLEWLGQRSPTVFRVSVWLIALLLVLCHAYLFRFAIGA